ncbi:MAG: nucleotide exchange factor GrpE [Proteobacteria bacterium]|nr:nucleotide exchange factor GrpE [Pseudomonadota bacterium]
MMNEDESKEIPVEGEEVEPQVAAAETPTTEESGSDSDEIDEEQVVETLLARIAELEDKRQRALADAENVRRRAERQQAETIAYANTAFARDLLSVSDNLDRALETGAGDPSAEGSAAFVEGVEMTRRELRAVLERNGVSKIEPLGEKFDHNFHQAMGEVDVADAAPGTVVEVIQSGYLLRDRLLRPAMVLVAGGAKNGEAKEE